METPEKILKQYWGYNSFRPLQQEIIQSVLERKDTLVLLPTGGGKSICYQVPALMLDGFCLVISPLIALMLDQVERLRELDIPAACIHSGMHFNDVKRTLEQAMHGTYKLLYISPERLQTNLFRDYMHEFDVSMIAVDEAHCISQWGHDFRPDYLKIANARATYPSAPVLALTATATGDVQQDITRQLKFRHPAIYRQSFARDNIFYEVNYSENKNGDTQRRINKQCSIIYCRSRKQTEAVSKYLSQSGTGTAAYHAGMSKERREDAQSLWMKDKAPIMIATTAFGMGIDKPGVRMVLHYDAPEHLEAYYQEAGRAGRDGKPSHALALYNSTDIKRLEDSIALQFPPEAYLRQVYQAVVEYLQIPIGVEPDKYYPFDLTDFCSKFSLQANQAIHALKLLEREGLWTMTEAVYSPATIQFVVDRHTLDDVGRAHPELGYVIIGLLRMYNTIFHFPTHVRETAIARQLKLQKEKELIPLLERLHNMGVLEYNRPGEGPQLFFHHYRVDSRHLIIDLKAIEALRRRHEQRTRTMVAYLENKTVCRERMLLAYFGEQVNYDCGHCDVCKNKQPQKINRQDLKHEILINVQRSGNISVQELTASYTDGVKEQVLEILRSMIDDHILALGADGIVKCR